MSELSLIFTPSKRNDILAIVQRLNGSLLGSVNLQSQSQEADMAHITTLFHSLQMQMDRQQRQFDYVLGGNISVPPPHHRDTNSKYDDRHCSDTEDMSTHSRQTDCTHDKGEDEIPFEDPRPRHNTEAEQPSNFIESDILNNTTTRMT